MNHRNRIKKIGVALGLGLGLWSGLSTESWAGCWQDCHWAPGREVCRVRRHRRVCHFEPGHRVCRTVCSHPGADPYARCWVDAYGVRHCRTRPYAGCYWSDVFHEWRCPSGGVIGISCAPEVREGNVVAVGRILKEVAALPEFASARKFQNVVAQDERFTTEQRLERYLGFLNIDARTADANSRVAEFAGAREIDPKVIDGLAEKLELNHEQAQLLAARIQKGLLGDLAE